MSKISNQSPGDKLSRGDWVMVLGEGSEAFQVDKVMATSVMLHTGLTEPIKKVIKLDPCKHKVRSDISFHWYEV